jgi:hypothetical protein
VRLPRVAASLGAALLTLGTLGLLAGPALADATIDTAAAALQNSPVYNDPTAQLALTDSQVSQLNNQVQATGMTMYLAVLPASVLADYGNSPNQVLKALEAAVGQPGTYAVVAGTKFDANNNAGLQVGGMADQALAQHKAEGAYAVLSAFVASVDAAANGSGNGSGATTSSSPSGSSGVGTFAIIAVLIVVGGLGIAVFSARSKSRAAARAAANLAEVKPAFVEDVTKLGEDIETLDLDIDAPATTDQMRQLYAKALDAYDAAKLALDRATNTLGLHDVASALEEGRYNLVAISALQAGKPLPERRAPCFFNPQHGPSTQDVTWTPPGGAAREVPVCDECAARLARGEDPDAKTVLVGGQHTPYWNAGPAYAGYAGGYYNGFGGILPGLLIGTMLGGSFGGFGWGGGYGGGYDGGGQFGGGDLGGGGGGFGGGDFGGGGGFGGGGFGGGDFGGGD